MFAAATITLISATTLAVLGLQEVNRRIRRHEQLEYLRGSLRQQVRYMLQSPPLTQAHLTTVQTVRPIQPAGLLTEQRLSA